MVLKIAESDCPIMHRCTTHARCYFPLNNLRCRPRSVSCQSQLGLLYSSCSDTTKRAAYDIHKRLAGACCSPIDVQQLKDVAQLKHYSGYMVGAPTYNTNAVSQRTGTAWDDLLYNGTLEQMRLLGKPFMVFGCGDAVRFRNNYADAIGELHDVFAAAGGIPLTASYCCSSSYLMKHSKAIRQHLKPCDEASAESLQQVHGVSSFVGLALDDVNQPELTDGRISSWCTAVMEQLQQEHPEVLKQPKPSVLQHKVHPQQLHLADGIAAAAQQQQQEQLHIGDWAADWPREGTFDQQYPRGFRFTDRWYQLGDRWYRFADQGFQVRAGFREHAVYTYAYRDVRSVQVHQPTISSTHLPPLVRPLQLQQQHEVQWEAEVWVLIGSPDSSDVGGTLLVLKGVECGAADGSNTIADFLCWQMKRCGNSVITVS